MGRIIAHIFTKLSSVQHHYVYYYVLYWNVPESENKLG